MSSSKFELEKEIQSLQRKSWKLKLCETNNNTNQNLQFKSNFNGLPYIEVGNSWPLNTSTRKPLDFIFQIINDGTYNWPKNIKILQFFYDQQTRPYNWKQPGWYIRTYEQVNTKKAQLLLLKKTPYTIELTLQTSLPSYESLSAYSPKLLAQCQAINNISPWDVYDDLVRQTIGQVEITSFIGGYPQWLQVDATPTFGDARSELLVQIDSEEIANIEWAHNGSLYLFYHPHKINDYGFVLQSM